MKETRCILCNEKVEIKATHEPQHVCKTYTSINVTRLLEHNKALVEALELIANGNIYFPNWADTVDVLIDVRKVAKEALTTYKGKE